MIQLKPASLASMPPKSDALASRLSDSDKYVDKLLRNAQPLPPITWSNWHKQVRWFNLSVIIITPLVALYGAATTRLDARTLWFCVLYYVFNMIGGLFLLCLAMDFISSDLVGHSKESRLVCALMHWCPHHLISSS